LHNTPKKAYGPSPAYTSGFRGLTSYREWQSLRLFRGQFHSSATDDRTKAKTRLETGAPTELCSKEDDGIPLVSLRWL